MRNVAQMYRCAVLICDDQAEIGVGILDLVVGVDRVGARWPVEISLGRVDVGVGDGGAQIIDIEAVGGERAQVGLDAHRRPLAPAMLTRPTPGSCEIFCANRVSARSST